MSNIIGAGVSVNGIVANDARFTFNAAAGITNADIGKAVMIDPSGQTQVKLATMGAAVFGRLLRVEQRIAEGITVCTVDTEGGLQFPVQSGVTITPSQILVGEDSAGAGYVKGVTTPVAGARFNVVTEVGTDYSGNGFAVALLH